MNASKVAVWRFIRGNQGGSVHLGVVLRQVKLKMLYVPDFRGCPSPIMIWAKLPLVTVGGNNYVARTPVKDWRPDAEGEPDYLIDLSENDPIPAEFLGYSNCAGRKNKLPDKPCAICGKWAHSGQEPS